MTVLAWHWKWLRRESTIVRQRGQISLRFVRLLLPCRWKTVVMVLHLLGPWWYKALRLRLLESNRAFILGNSATGLLSCVRQHWWGYIDGLKLLINLVWWLICVSWWVQDCGLIFHCFAATAILLFLPELALCSIFSSVNGGRGCLWFFGEHCLCLFFIRCGLVVMLAYFGVKVCRIYRV